MPHTILIIDMATVEFKLIAEYFSFRMDGYSVLETMGKMKIPPCAINAIEQEIDRLVAKKISELKEVTNETKIHRLQSEIPNPLSD